MSSRKTRAAHFEGESKEEGRAEQWKDLPLARKAVRDWASWAPMPHNSIRERELTHTNELLEIGRLKIEEVNSFEIVEPPRLVIVEAASRGVAK